MSKKISHTLVGGRTVAGTGGQGLKVGSQGKLYWLDVDEVTLIPWAFPGSNYGYSIGGDGSANNIEKFTFASAGNASNVADLTRSVNSIAGTSSADHGYSIGGASSDVIDRFPFASDTNASDVGDITANRGNLVGSRYRLWLCCWR